MELLLKRTARYSFIFLTMAMIAIVYFGATKVIEISDIAQDDVDRNAAPETTVTEDQMQNVLMFDTASEYTDYLGIPLPDGVTADDISVENHYMDHQLYVTIKCEERDYYGRKALTGNRDSIREGTFDITDDGVSLKFAVDNVYEYKTVLENNSLYISFFTPRELFDKIVIIDPAHGGNDSGVSNYATGPDSKGEETISEKNINLKVAKRLKELLDTSEIKAYYTRMDDVNPSGDARTDLGNAIRADAYIRIEVDKKEDSSLYGMTCKYNEEYFIPGFGNVQLADIIEKAVVTSAKGRALGLVPSDEGDPTLLRSTIPSCTIMVGCLSNKQEAILLSRDDYIDKLAQGIYDG
ncbi:MAG: N-acetylmuramoyl-L-alanine amidase, partial [Lachnospiraceae bacterium]|nr:N-acetylmuramoyl-L-alanine amidase [Lachnospiraceae bacterium]